MKRAEKRKVVEVLLCSVVVGASRRTTWETCRLLGVDDRGLVATTAGKAWTSACGRAWPPTAPHFVTCLEAAYRLIETSPALRREWFGR
jgi:hypothetical protein